jgi:hypothetical protein
VKYAFCLAVCDAFIHPQCLNVWWLFGAIKKLSGGVKRKAQDKSE